MTLIDRLCRLAELWASAQGKELSTLGTLVAKDGKFFARLGEGKTCTVALFERFLTFFREPANWPEDAIPADAAAMLDEVEMIAVGGSPAVGRELQISAHDLMATRAAEWPIEAPRGGEPSDRLRTGHGAEVAADAPFSSPAAEPPSPVPTLTGAPAPAPPSPPVPSRAEGPCEPPISSTSSTILEPLQPPAASPNSPCSEVGKAEAA